MDSIANTIPKNPIEVIKAHINKVCFLILLGLLYGNFPKCIMTIIYWIDIHNEFVTDATKLTEY